MKVLIVGNYSFVVDGLVQRFNREDLDIYVLTNKENNVQIQKKLPSHMDFQTDFSKKDVRYIMQCVQPDVVVLAEAFADTYDWDQEDMDAKYSGDIANIMHWCSYFHVKKVIYMSSMLSYEKNAQFDLDEQTIPQALGNKQRLIMNGEKLVHMYQSDEMQVISMRFPVLFGPQFNSLERLNKVSKMCYDALHQQTVFTMGYEKYALIFINDAVEAVFRVIQKEKPEHDLYHIPGTRLVTDEEIATLITKNTKETDSLELHVDKTACRPQQLSLNGTRFAKEFDFHLFMEPERGIELTVQNVQKNYRIYEEAEKKLNDKKKAQQKEETKDRWKTILKPLEGIGENIILFVISTVVFLAFHNLEMFSRIDFFLLYILLMAAGVGIANGIVAVLLSMGVEIWYLCSQGYSFTAVIGSYSIVVLFLYRIILALFVSYWILRTENMKKEVEEELEEVNKDYEMLTEINQTNVEVKKIFEDRLINYKDSIGKIYNIVSELDVLDPEQIVEASLNVIHRIMGVDDISIYQVASQGYCHHIVSSFSAERPLGNTIQLGDYPQMSTVMENQDIFMNTEIKSSLPRMAAPIFSHGKMIYIIMLWNMEFASVTLYQKNLFMVLSKIITGSLEKAAIYEQDAHDRKYYSNTNIMRETYFEQLLDKISRRDVERASEYTLLEVPYRTDVSKETLSATLERVLRESDRIGFREGISNYVFVLAQCRKDEVHFVQRKLQREGLEGTVVTYGS